MFDRRIGHAAKSITGVSMTRLGGLPSRMSCWIRSTTSGEKKRSPVSSSTRAGTFSITIRRPSTSSVYVTRRSTSRSLFRLGCISTPPLAEPGLPPFRVGLVQCDDLHHRTRGVTDLHVERPSGGRKAEQQAARAVLVVRVVLDHLGVLYRL